MADCGRPSDFDDAVRLALRGLIHHDWVIRVINYVPVVWLDNGLERRTNARNPRWLLGRQASAQHDEGNGYD